MLAIDSLDRARLPAWIGQRLARQQQRAPDEALAFIADRVEGNLLAAHQEIVKLGLLYPTGQLSIEQVREAVLDVARYDVFELPSVMLAGDATRVARTLGGLRAEGEPLPLIVWAVSEELRALARVKSQVQAGRSFSEAARASGIWGPRQAQVERALGRVDLDRLEQSLARIGQIDRLIKGLRAPELDSDPWLELCDIMIDVARPAPRIPASAHR
jgi:DNA polymerase-3 subunit delta